MKAIQLIVQQLKEESLQAAQGKSEKELTLLKEVLEIYDQKTVAECLRSVSGHDWTRESVNRWVNGKALPKALSEVELKMLSSLLPKPPVNHPHYAFRFVDLFAGIGGIRSGFEAIGGQCVFTSEWNPQAVRTYKANWYNPRDTHVFNQDIREITLSHRPEIAEQEAYAHIDSHIPHHDVLLAGFPCQPFSLAGVSKKNSLGKAHGFECQTQGTLFFDVARIIAVKKPAIFVLENVKNLKSHDQGKTFSIIQETLDELGYDVADSQSSAINDPKVIDGKHFLPQHRERIVLVGFRRDLNLLGDFTLQNIEKHYPQNLPSFKSLLDDEVSDKYILSVKLWEYLYFYAKKHQAKGNGFGFGLVSPDNEQVITRTLSARYHKDGSEILIDRGWDKEKGELDFHDATNIARRPRRLTPRECARLMGFEKPGEYKFRIPVSDTQAYRQFGNSVVVPVFAAVAKMLEPYIKQATGKTALADQQDAEHRE